MELVKLAQKNAQNALDHHYQSEQVKYMRTTLAMKELMEALHLPNLPRRIEGYDISNTQGILSVASMVVFEGGMPPKGIPPLPYQDRGGSQRLCLHGGSHRAALHPRPAGKARAGGAGPAGPGGRFSTLPDVVLIDGGPEQLLFAHRAMEEAGASVPMFGLAKQI